MEPSVTSANEARNDDFVYTLFHLRTPNLGAEAEKSYILDNLSLKMFLRCS